LTTSRIRLALVEDHALVRDGLLAVLGQAEDIQIVGTAADGVQAQELCRAEKPEVLLLDLRLPLLDGVSVLEALRKEGTSVRTLLMSSYEGSDMVLRAMRVGARGFVAKNAPASELLSAIRAVHAGALVLPQELQERLIATPPSPDVPTGRELQVLRLVARGLSNSEIGKEMGISAATAKNHIQHIMSKLGAADRTHAVVLSLKQGFLDLD